MSDTGIEKVEDLLSGVSADVNRMYSQALENDETFLAALDDVAAHVFALEAVVAALVKQHPIAEEDAKAWLTANMDAEGQGREKAEAVIEALLA